MAVFSNNRSRGASRAFTLVEMMVSLVVFSLVMSAMVAGSIALERAFAGVDTYTSANADEMRILDYIARDVRDSLSSQSPQVIIGSSPTSLQVTIPQYYNSSGSANTPTVSGSTATYSGTSIVVTYALNGTTLTRAQGGDPAVVLSGSIQSFTPVQDTTYDPTGRTIKISLTFSSIFQAAWSTAGTTFTTRVSTRP